MKTSEDSTLPGNAAIGQEAVGPEAIGQEAIAQKLNLSPGTVSRALRNLPNIHPETRSLVMQTALEMGYRPLRNRRHPKPKTAHHLIGVFVRSAHQKWRSLPFLTGMSGATNDLNVSLVLQHFGLSEGENFLDPARQPPAVRDGSLAGIVLIHRWPDAVMSHLAERFPCVSLVHQLEGGALDVVGMDHFEGMVKLMEHLHAQGHRKIGFIGRNPELSWAKSRYLGYVKGLYELGLPFEPQHVIDMTTSNLEDRESPWGDEVERVIALMQQGVRAWMASNDRAGYFLCRSLLDRGIRVPEDVSITGFDRSEDPMLRCPLLTSVKVPQEQMGAEALRRIIQRVHEPSTPTQSILFRCVFSEGETTGQAPNASFQP